MIFPITSTALVGCLLWSYSKDGPRSSLLVALAVWAIEILLLAVPVFQYDVGYSVVADAFVAGSLGAITIGYLLLRSPRRVPPRTHQNRRREVMVAKVLGVLGCIGSVLLLIDAQASGTTLSISYLLENLTLIREANFQNLEESGSVTPIALVGSYLAACSFLSVIAAARLGKAGGQAVLLLGVGNFILITAVGLLVYGGRTTLFYAALLTLVSAYVGGRRLPKPNAKTLLVGAVVLVAIWYFSVSWFSTREGGSVDTEFVLQDNQRAKYRPWLAPIVSSNENIGLALVSLGYFSSPLPTLAFYVQREPRPGPYYGGYSYPLPARTLAKVTGTHRPTRWVEIRREVFSPLEAAGYFGNVWATWLRDLLIDFGYLGAILFCGLFGGFMAWARNRFESTGALHYHYLEVIACFTLAFGAFQSVLWFSFLSYAFFVSVLVMFATRITVRASGIHDPTSRPASQHPIPSERHGLDRTIEVRDAFRGR